MRGITSWLPVIGLVGVLAACGSASAGQSPARQPPPATSVISGTVSAGPVTPVSRPGQANSRPVRGARVEALRDGKVAGVSVTDHAGRFRLTLPPGTYVIEPTAPGLRFARPEPKTVTVLGGHEQTVNFVLDTGIR